MSHRPLITSFAPAAVAVGDTVAISGLYLDDASAVSVGGTPATSFSVISPTILHATIAGGTTTGRIAVTTPGGTSTSKNSLTVLTAAPTVTHLSAATGKAGDSLTVTGTGFTGATAATIGGVSAEYTVESDTLLTLLVPAGTVTGVIVVTGPAGIGTGSDTFTYVPTPAISSVSPLKAAGGGSVVISGSGLTGATVVTVGGTPAASYVVNNDSKITAVLGSGTTGHVAVTNTHGTATSTDTVTVIAAPTITSFTPTSGPTGTTVTITGTNLADATAVTVNGTPAHFVVLSATSIQTVSPTGATVGHVAVTTPADTIASSGNFTPTAAPEIDYVSPLYAQVGDTVTVHGAGLTGATAVSLGGVACTGVVVGSDSSLTAVIAAATPSGTVKVTTPGGVVTSEQSVAILAVPTVSARAPGSGSIGAAVLITGTGFVGISGVSFNGHAAPFAVLSPTRIRATVPADATTGTITVTNAAGTGTSASFTVV